MTTPNWGLIRSGATFERLAATLLFFQDSNARLFGRRGKDGGQDAISGDRKTVYQAKHHERPSASKAISAAKREAKKIAAYRKPSHARHGQWVSVERWVLVTNAAFNPADAKRWDDEVVPLFDKLDLDAAEYWEASNLEALLTKYPSVQQCFFEGRPHVLLGVAEAEKKLSRDAPFSFPSALSAPFVGRDAGLAEARRFLDEPPSFLLITGAGGVGKTRFLTELGAQVAADGGWDVYWANVETMSVAARWFDALVPERKVLLLVDEPREEQLLRQLVEQTGQQLGRMGEWKVAVTVRSPKDPVIRFMKGPRMQQRVTEVPLVKLDPVPAELLCRELIDAGRQLGGKPEDWKRDAATKLAAAFDQHPIWLTLAVHLLEQHGNLEQMATSSDALADEYVVEMIQLATDSPPETVQGLLRWTALLRTVDREDTPLLGHIASKVGVDTDTVLRGLGTLVTRHALRQWGARDRLVDVKPDVIRDHILRKWLVLDMQFGPARYQPSNDAKALVAEVTTAISGGSSPASSKSILISLARTEWTLRTAGQNVSLLGGLFGWIEGNLSDLSATTRESLAELVVDIAVPRPMDVVALSRSQRATPCGPVELTWALTKTTVTHDDVVLAMAWPLFHACMGAELPDEKRACLGELFELLVVEQRVRKERGSLYNDGKHAEGLMRRVIGGGPQFSGDFDVELEAFLLHLLADPRVRLALPEQRAALERLAKAVTEALRQASWSEDRSFVMQNYAPGPSSAAWRARTAVVDRAKELLRDGALDLDLRVSLWRVLANAQASLTRMRGEVKELPEQLAAAQLTNLEFTLEVLEARTSEARELKAARRVWDWHAEFDDDPARRELADKLEALLETNSTAALFEALLGSLDIERQQAAVEKVLLTLSGVSEPVELRNFIESGRSYLDGDPDIGGLLQVAHGLGAHVSQNAALCAFVAETMADPGSDPLIRSFATVLAAAFVSAVRSGGGNATELVDRLLAIATPDNGASLLQRTYGGMGPPRHAAEMAESEYELIWASWGRFRDTQFHWAFFDVVGWTHVHSFGRMRTAAEAALVEVQETSEHERCLRTLVETACRGVLWLREQEDPPATLSDDLGEWLLDRIAEAADVSDVIAKVAWHLNQVLRTTRRPTFRWSVDLLLRRAEAARTPDARFRGLGSTPRLTSFATAITAEQARDEAAIGAVEELLRLVTDAGDVGYHLPELLQDIDPSGVVAPAVIARRIPETQDAELLRRHARLAKAYALGSPPWRVIAEAAAGEVLNAEPSQQSAVYAALTDLRRRTYGGVPGEVPKLFRDAVDAARARVAEEADPAIRSMWEWQLERARAELAREEQEAKEERGE